MLIETLIEKTSVSDSVRIKRLIYFFQQDGTPRTSRATKNGFFWVMNVQLLKDRLEQSPGLNISGIFFLEGRKTVHQQKQGNLQNFPVTGKKHRGKAPENIWNLGLTC